MITRRLAVLLGLLAVIVCAAVLWERLYLKPATTGQAVRQPPPVPRKGQPIVNLLAPSARYGDRYDCLIPEAALRLTAIDLAARCGKFVRFWPVDQTSQGAAGRVSPRDHPR